MSLKVTKQGLEGLIMKRTAIYDCTMSVVQNHVDSIRMFGQNLTNSQGAEFLVNVALGEPIAPGMYTVRYPEFHLSMSLLTGFMDKMAGLDDSYSITLITTCSIALSRFKCDELLVRVDATVDCKPTQIEYVESPKTFFGARIDSAFKRGGEIRKKYDQEVNNG